MTREEAKEALEALGAEGLGLRVEEDRGRDRRREPRARRSRRREKAGVPVLDEAALVALLGA